MNLKKSDISLTLSILAIVISGISLIPAFYGPILAQKTECEFLSKEIQNLQLAINDVELALRNDNISLPIRDSLETQLLILNQDIKNYNLKKQILCEK